MHTLQVTSIPEEKLRAIVSQFIKTLHEAGERSISNINITFHGCVSQFSAGKKTHAVQLSNKGNTKMLFYQELSVEAPIRNMITIIAPAQAEE